MPLIALTDALATRVPMLAFPTKFKWIGGLSRSFNMMVWGPPESRKSSLTLQLADELTRHGSVCLMMMEENPEGAALKDRATRNSINNRKINLLKVRSFEEVKKALATYRLDFVVIDSVSAFLPGVKATDFIRLAEEYNGRTSFIFIFQVTADKRKYRDGIQMHHFVDVLITCDKGTAIVDRNRPTGVVGGRYEIR
jgi:KaiC/GvpD/RAD55 family RecA-like ATPase